ncbi:MAG: hypothetical protein HZA54_00975 [Planctomycetes bacterium]|nr:hypothetical protein [Planctomycetota bacterium]
MEFLKIVALALGAAIAYGIAHDQITARVCVEYFTIGHARLIDTDSPTLLGLVWGVVATWWVGVGLGVPLACAARLGGAPKTTARDLVPALAALLGVMGVAALVAGRIGWLLAEGGLVRLIGPIALRVPADRHVPFLADLWAHSASYALGGLGGVWLIVRTVRRRRRLRAAPTPGK